MLLIRENRKTIPKTKTKTKTKTIPRTSSGIGMGSSSKAESGLTLLEVLFALLITGMFLIMAMGFFTDQWRGARSLKHHLEAHYFVMTAGKTVSDAIRTAETVEWVPESRILKVLPLPNSANLAPSLDTYFVGDLDYNGTKDLYWRHKNVSQPVSSYITGWNCVEVEPGLWEIFMQASMEGQTIIWESIIRQRAYSTLSHVTPLTLAPIELVYTVTATKAY